MAAKAQTIAAQGIGERLVAALRRRGLSPDTLADRLGIDVAALRDAIERDRLRADVVPTLAKRLGIEPAWLLYGQEEDDAPGAPGHATPFAPPAIVAADAGDDGDEAPDDASCLTQADAVARVLRALPGGERGRALKLAVLDALDASTREDAVALPLAVRGLRRRVQDLTL